MHKGTASRLARLNGHLSPRVAASEPTAGVVKRLLGSLFGGGGGDDIEPVAVVESKAHPRQGVDTGHVHPSICKTADGTLIIVYAANEDDSPGKDVLMCTRSTDSGATWSVSSPIECTRFSEKPDAVADSDTHEVYPGTLTALPDDRVLCTWDYTYGKYPDQGRPLLYTISEDQGQTWGAQQLIFDPADPPNAKLDVNQHLGTLRHSILVEDDGRWLLPLTVGGPRGSPTGEGVGTRSLCEWYGLEYPGVQIYDPDSGSLEPVPELSPGREGSHPALEYPILQLARNGGSGPMLAMGKGNSGHNQDPPVAPSPAPVLFSGGKGQPWTEVEGFPANVECPDGVKMEEWDGTHARCNMSTPRTPYTFALRKLWLYRTERSACDAQTMATVGAVTCWHLRTVAFWWSGSWLATVLSRPLASTAASALTGKHGTAQKQSPSFRTQWS